MSKRKEVKRHWMESKAMACMPQYRALVSRAGSEAELSRRLVEAGCTPYDLYDLTSAFTIPDRWLESGRQIFVFDPNASEMIGHTDGLPDLRSVLESVPYGSFAVDLDGTRGFFFEVGKTAPEYSVENVFGKSAVDESEHIEGRHTNYELDDGTMMAFNWTPVSTEDAPDPRASGKSAHEYLTTEGIIETAFVENIVAYLCCKNAEIRTVYKPPKEPGRRRSAATWHQVGYRIGAELRAYERAASGRKPHQGGTVRPHMRRAHWHHFWTGPRDGERKLVLKWVPPTMVALKNGEIDGATGHRVPVSGDGE